MAALLELRNFTVELPTAAGWIRPVAEVSLAIEPGGSLGLVGESGSGKTMLALALLGLLPAGARVKGEALLAGGEGGAIDLAAMAGEAEAWRGIRGKRIAMIFQEPMTALNPVMRVGSQIAETIRAHEPGLRGGQLAQRVREAMEQAAIPEPEERARQYPHELSGGLRQRVLIAIALAAGGTQNGAARGGRLLIADEPTTALDVTVQKQILEVLARLRRELGIALLFITHDLGVVAQVAERVAVMQGGHVVEQGPAEDVLRRPKDAYTQALLRASPRLQRRAAI